MSRYYAQINTGNVCYAVTETREEIVQADMIELDSYNLSLLGKEYVSATQSWIDGSTPIVSNSPTLTEIQENQLIIMEAIADLYTDLGLGGI